MAYGKSAKRANTPQAKRFAVAAKRCWTQVSNDLRGGASGSAQKLAGSCIRKALKKGGAKKGGAKKGRK